MWVSAQLSAVEFPSSLFLRVVLRVVVCQKHLFEGTHFSRRKVAIRAGGTWPTTTLPPTCRRDE